MTLYYHKDTYEIKDIDNNIINGWIANDNPKKNNWIVLTERPGDNYYWNSGQWIQYSTPVPESISARQIRLWLINNNISLDQIDAAIDSISDQTLKEITKIEWEYAPYIERSHPMLVLLAQALGLSQNQIDSAFIEAQNI